MKKKYIEERFEPYFEFGRKDNRVDLASATDITVVSLISKDEAEKLINNRNKMIDFIHTLSEKFGKDFDEIWYKEI